MYNINRQEAADILWISTRSIDRYIKSWKIRSEKDWKIVMLNSDDIKVLNWESVIKHKIIVNDEINNNYMDENKLEENTNTWVVKKSEYEKVLVTFEKMYSGFREEIREKDQRIEKLAMELWQAREQKNNSIDIMEYKKIQFLSEESKSNLSNEIEKGIQEKINIIKELKYEKTTNKLLIAFIVILFVILGAVFFINI